MVKRSTVLKFYDRVHINSVRVCWAVGLTAAAFTLVRIGEILFVPKIPCNIQDDPDFKKIMEQQRLKAAETN